MSAWNDTSSGVVNPDLTVKGVKGLRIVDAGILVGLVLRCLQCERDLANDIDCSAFALSFSIWMQPFVPAAHTQASVYIIAERAAALIKAAASS